MSTTIDTFLFSAHPYGLTGSPKVTRYSLHKRTRRFLFLILLCNEVKSGRALDNGYCGVALNRVWKERWFFNLGNVFQRLGRAKNQVGGVQTAPSCVLWSAAVSSFYFRLYKLIDRYFKLLSRWCEVVKFRFSMEGTNPFQCFYNSSLVIHVELTYVLVRVCSVSSFTVSKCRPSSRIFYLPRKAFNFLTHWQQYVQPADTRGVQNGTARLQENHFSDWNI